MPSVREMKRAQRWERTRTVRPSLDRLWNLLALPLLVFISLPLAALFLRASFDDFIDALGQPQVGMAIRLSLVSSLTFHSRRAFGGDAGRLHPWRGGT
ncbi:MAG: hypothetical protein UZ18_ATM001000044, partial [Armatimonadetes bacterium OLB18]